jgi:hypothetical protein
MIVLGYMKSCWRETISGVGAVIVGTEQSGVPNIALKPGGLYSAGLGTRQIVFEVDREAAAGTALRRCNQGGPADYLKCPCP